MNYVQQSVERTRKLKCAVFRESGPTATTGIGSLFLQSVLPQFSLPAHRQGEAIEGLEHEPSPDVILDSPSFTPESLVAFRAHGSVRRNRWSK
jgi:hypothetical protein